MRKGYRALRHREIVYALVETGMWRAAVTKLNVDNVDLKRGPSLVEEKGGVSHGYQISNEGLHAIRDYLERERPQDNEKWRTPALSLSPSTDPNGNGRLTVKVIMDVWNEVSRSPVSKVRPHTRPGMLWLST